MLCRLAILTTPGYRERTTPDGCSDAIHRFKANVLRTTGTRRRRAPRRGQASPGIASPAAGTPGITAPAGPARASTAARPRAASGIGPAGRRVSTTQLSHVRAAAGGALDPIEPNSATQRAVRSVRSRLMLDVAVSPDA